ncbi:hypothetical protein UlMin_021705 [Ulmus minor]
MAKTSNHNPNNGNSWTPLHPMFQVENMILGYGLKDFIYGTCNVPPRLLAREVNPAFIRHQRQDRLLVSWILASIFMFYKREIQLLKKDNLSMREYLLKMKSYFDMLNAANHSMTDTDQILALLNGLGDEYESIVAISCSREIPYTLQHVNTLILSHEDHILQKNSATNDISVNLANYRKGSNGASQNNNQGGRGYNGYHGRGRGGRSNNNRPQCQLCGKIGHIVIKCYYRFDHSYQGSGGSNSLSSFNQNYNPTQNNINWAHTQEEVPFEQAPA